MLRLRQRALPNYFLQVIFSEGRSLHGKRERLNYAITDTQPDQLTLNLAEGNAWLPV